MSLYKLLTHDVQGRTLQFPHTHTHTQNAGVNERKQVQIYPYVLENSDFVINIF